jgi:uncharacterized membrane protein YcaP (DUF421 family)
MSLHLLLSFIPAAGESVPLSSNIWLPEVPWLDKIVRGAVVYLFILIALRIFGKRQVGMMTQTDLIVLMVLSNILQNAMIGPDNSVLGGFIGAATILVINYGVSWFTVRSHKFERWVEGTPTPIVFNGVVMEKNLKAEMLTHEDLLSALRRQGVFNLHDIKLAVIEENGLLSVLRRDGRDHDGTPEEGTEQPVKKE